MEHEQQHQGGQCQPEGPGSQQNPLPPGKNALQASCVTTGVTQMFVRFGLSPDLLDLLTGGQAHLGNLLTNSQEIDLFNTNSGRLVRDCDPS